MVTQWLEDLIKYGMIAPLKLGDGPYEIFTSIFTIYQLALHASIVGCYGHLVFKVIPIFGALKKKLQQCGYNL